MRVVDAAVDANLGEDLSPGAFLLERALGDHLGGEVLARRRVLHSVHDRESAFAERPAANVRARLGVAGARALVAFGDDARALDLLRTIAASDIGGMGRGIGQRRVPGARGREGSYCREGSERLDGGAFQSRATFASRVSSRVVRTVSSPRAWPASHSPA